ncbi:MAG: amino acid racemase [Planctomycetia bacterium]|nr:amino acid racemase [Planctomycetia bacterium]
MKLGIIGGNGVAATNLLNTMIEQQLTHAGAYRDCHHPEIITWQATNVPSRSMYLEGRGESFIPGYVEIGTQLKNLGCQQLCMCCNTAHFAIDELTSKIGIPFFNMVEQVIARAMQSPAKRIGLIASDGCLKGRVYEKYLSPSQLERMVYPDADFQKMVTAGICNVKNANRFLPTDNENNPQNQFEQVCRFLHSKSAELIILGCTDIAVSFQRVEYDECPILNSLQVLCDMICQWVYDHNFSPNTEGKRT